MWLIFALLVSLAAFFIILPLFKKEIENESLSLNMEQLENNSVFRDQKIKLSNMLENGLIDITEYSKLILEYQRISLRDADGYSKPTTNISDNKNITVGNPNLTPSTTKQLEIGYNSFGRKYQGSYYVYYKLVTNNKVIL